MSTGVSVVFYGIRIDIQETEIEALEDRSDYRLVAARKNGLSNYWGNFASSGEKWFLFIGASLGVFGLEGLSDAQFGKESLQDIMIETQKNLRQAGFAENPRLYIQYQPNI
jgi:hypothetical protein